MSEQEKRKLALLWCLLNAFERGDVMARIEKLIGHEACLDVWNEYNASRPAILSAVHPALVEARRGK